MKSEALHNPEYLAFAVCILVKEGWVYSLKRKAWIHPDQYEVGRGWFTVLEFTLAQALEKCHVPDDLDFDRGPDSDGP